MDSRRRNDEAICFSRRRWLAACASALAGAAAMAAIPRSAWERSIAAKPLTQELPLVLVGPFPSDVPIDLEVLEPTFCEPWEVEVAHRATHARITVQFVFLGNVDEGRRIQLVVTLRTAAGELLYEAERECSDSRAATTVPGASKIAMPARHNIEKFYLPSHVLDRAMVMTIEFVEN